MITELNKDWLNVLSKDRIAVVKCYGTWCGPCKFYSPHFQKFSDTFSVYNNEEIRYYQSDNDKLPDLGKKYMVDRLPSTLFLVHGILAYKIYGITRSKIFENILKHSLDIKYHIQKE